MKKLFALILSLSMVLSFAACGDGSDKTDDKKETTTTATEVVATTAAETTAAETTAAETTAAETTVAEATVAETTAPAPSEDLPAGTIADTDLYSIVITGIEKSEMGDFEIGVELENRSADKNYTFNTWDAAVNGVQASCVLYEEVAAGKKANAEILLFTSAIPEGVIDDATVIELDFYVEDADDIFADRVADISYTYYPEGEAAATYYEREPAADEIVLVDNDYFTMALTGYEIDDFWGHTFSIVVINKSDKNLNLSADNVSVNDYMVDPIYYETVFPGKIAFTEMIWDSDELAKNGITEIAKVEFDIVAIDADSEDWFADPLVTEKVIVE